MKLFKNKRILIISVLTIVIIAIVGSLIIFRNQGEEVEAADWFDESYYYRQSVEVGNSSGSEATNQYVKITLDTSSLITNSKLQSDCADIRITDKDGKLLNHFVNGDSLYTCNDTDTEIFAIVPTLPTATSTFYIYYGNPSAEDNESTLGSEENPGISCKTIYDHGDSSTDGKQYIAPSGDVDDKVQAFCNMTTASGGWTLLFQRRGGASYNNVEACGSNLNTFLRDTCGDVDYLDYGDSYSLDVDTFTHYGAYLNKQFSSSMVYDSDDSFIIHSSSTNIFPDSTGIMNDIAVDSVCDYTDGSCDSSDVYIKYAGNGWYGSALCDNGFSTGSYVGNWGYCQNGVSTTYTSNALFGNRNGYTETKLWNLDSGSDVYMGRIFIREDSIAFDNFYAASPSSEEQGPGPVAYWSFDEGYGTTAYDQSPNNYDGTITNALWKNESDCISGKCLYFDGNNDYVSLSMGAASTTISDDIFTWSLWVKPMDVGLPQIIMSATDNNGIGDTNGAGELAISNNQFRWQVAENESTSLASYNISTTTKWQHLVGVKNGTDMDLYVNGILVASNSGSAEDVSSFVPLSFNVGKPHSDTRNLTGFIDEVKVYDYARSADQIKQDYNLGASVYFGESSDQGLSEGLVAHWKMDESSWSGADDEVIDISGNENHLKTYGGASTTVAAKFGMSGGFDGVDDYARVNNGGATPTKLHFGATNPWTFSHWMKWDGEDTRQYVFYAGLASGSEGLLTRYSSINRFAIRNVNATYFNFGDSTDYIEKWTYVSWVADGQGNLALYLNGELSNQQYVADSSMEFNGIGTGYGGTSYVYDGDLDDVRIYNRALNPEEIRNLYEWAPEPVAHWKFDEHTGTSNVEDSSGNDNQGTMTGSMTEDDWVPGKFGSSLDFDGTDDEISVTNDASLQIIGDLTIEAWVYAHDLADMFLNKDYLQEFSIRTDDSDRISAIHGNGSDYVGYQFFGAWGTEDLNKWNHLAIVRDNQAQEYRLYENGIEQAGSITSGPWINATAASDPVLIGSGVWGVGYNGKLDDVRIYNYARTQRQIYEDMNAGKKNNPKNYWSFDDGQGTTAYDTGLTKEIIGTGQDGTLTNMSTTGTSSAWSQNGVSGKAIKFDGSDDFVSFGNINEAVSEISLSAWFRTNNMSHNGFIVGKSRYPASTYGYGIYLNNGTIRAVSGNGAAETDFYDNLTYDVSGMVGEWIHVTASWDDNFDQGRLYINGELVKIYSSSQLYLGTGSSRYFSVGAGHRTTDQGSFFDGQIDEVKAYNYIVTLDEVRQNYNQGKQIALSKTKEDVQQTSEGLVGWWKMDEDSWAGTSEEVVDYSGIGNHGTGVASANTTSTAKYGRTGLFNGTDEYVNIGDLNTYEFGTGSFTLSTWFNRTGDSPGDSYGGCLICKGSYSAANPGYAMYIINDTDLVGFQVRQSDDTMFALTAVDAISDDQWYHAAVVRDSDVGSIYLYIDGEKVSEVQETTLVDVTGTREVRIGALDDGSRGREFYGKIDDAKIYNYARSPEQIMNDYTMTRPPVAHWKFDEMSGTTSVDSSGNGNDLTFSNTPTWHARGKKGSALDFDGSDDSISNTDITEVNSPVGSISYWLWIDETDTNMGMFHYYENAGSSQDYIRNYINGSNNRIDLYIEDDNVTKVGVLYDLDDLGEYTKQWLHFVWTQDGTGVKLYINGDQKTLILGTNSGDWWTDHLGGAQTVNLGAAWSYYNGKMDEVKMWDYALNPRQVAKEYSEGKPIGYWKLDKGEGGTAYDYSGNDYNGTVYPGTSGDNTTTSTMWSNGSSGKINSSMDFDGIDDEVNLGSTQFINTGKPFTISTWSYLDSFVDNYPTIFASETDTNTWRMAFSNAGGYSDFCFGAGTGWVDGRVVDMGDHLNKWNHVVITYNGEDATVLSNFKLYLDGKEQTLTTASAFGSSTSNSKIGNNQTTSHHWNGRIDEVKVFNYEFTPEEVKKEYNGGFSSFFK